MLFKRHAKGLFINCVLQLGGWVVGCPWGYDLEHRGGIEGREGSEHFQNYVM